MARLGLAPSRIPRQKWADPHEPEAGWRSLLGHAACFTPLRE
jgi:hypothetical protein